MESINRGVFARTREKNTDLNSMIECLEALRNYNAGIRITSIRSDEKYRGFRIFFSEPSDSELLNSMIFPTIKFNGQDISIYPLTTYLLISKLNREIKREFEKHLRESLQELFKTAELIIFNISKIPGESDCWSIEINIPECKDLEVFRRINLSEMRIFLPDINQEFPVELWCRQCNECGHFQHECPSKARVETNEKKKKKSRSKQQTEENFPEGSSSSKSPDRDLDTTRERFPGANNIKDRDETKEKYNKRQGKKSKSPLQAKQSSDFADSSNESPADDNDKNESNPSLSAKARDCEGSIPSGNLEDSNESAGASAPADTSARKSSSSRKSSTGRKSLQNCIDESCKEGILDREKLDDFFSKVKKKKNPLNVVKIFTENVSGLIKQLNKIKDEYCKAYEEKYTNDDKTFINWLENLIRRIETQLSNETNVDPHTKKKEKK